MDITAEAEQRADMKKYMAMLLVMMTLTACGPDPQPAEPAEVPAVPEAVKEEPKETPKEAVKAEAKGDVLRKKTGETFVIELESNPSTGFRWALDGTEDATVVRKVSDGYASHAHAPGLVGVGGTETWTFQAAKKGQTALHFIYHRPWEKGLDPARERTIQVEVE